MAGSGTRSRENNSGAGGGVPVTLATCMSTHLENIAIGELPKSSSKSG